MKALLLQKVCWVTMLDCLVVLHWLRTDNLVSMAEQKISSVHKRNNQMRNKKHTAVLLTTALLISVISSSAWAKPTTSGQAAAVVKAWRQNDTKPLKSAIGKATNTVQTYRDVSGTDLYHVVSLDPSGFAIVPADDLVEPIIAFSSDGTFDPSDTNPLGALVSRDLPGRIAHVRGGGAPSSLEMSGSPTSEQVAALNKWEQLQGVTPTLSYGLSTPSDVRVSPLIQSKWNQSTVNNNVCYNYYTPNNNVSGCVATAMSQLMRYFQYPITPVGTASFTIYVDGVSSSEALMGGNGSGGAYNWAQMPLVPDSTVTDTQRQAIGRLLHDTGATVNMQYTLNSSGANGLKPATALKATFGYSNAVKGFNSNLNISADARNTMVNPNLDAGLPVLFTIRNSTSGHEVVGDGYGYQSETMYHHLNMGWGGNNDLWYNLPNIDDSFYGFTTVDGVVYNVYTSGTGEIVSGRIVDCAGAPASGVAVTASLGGNVIASTTTNNNGIYALKGLASSSTYTIAASKNGFTFTPQTATTGISSDYNSTPGNKWGVDFANSSCSSSTLSIIKSGSGTVTSLPVGISCGATCSTSFASPSSIALTATADPGYAFTGWSGGGCSGNGTCVVSLTANATVTATFSPVAVLFSEPFSGTSVPSGWTAQDNLGVAGRNWSFGAPRCYANNTGGSGYFAIAETNCGTGVYNVDSSLISPSYNLSQYAGVTLSFKTYLKYWYDATMDVDVSDDGGANWSNVWRKGSGTNGTFYGPATETLDVTSVLAGKSNAKVRFRFYNNVATYGSYVEIDDFTLSGAIVSTVTAPTATTGAASGISGTSATLNGSINDNGATTTATFQYGQTASYGSSVSGGTISAGTGATPVNAAISSLTCNTTYHFKLAGTNSVGTTNGSDQTFITSPCVPGAPVITSVKAGNNQANIYYSPSVSDGGSSITGYRVSSSVGTTLPSLLIPITVSGLTNGASYSFTVTAINAAGPGTPSTQSDSLRPGLVVNKGFDEIGYMTLQDAYDANTLTTEFQIVSGASVGPFLKTNSNDVTIVGGYDAAFTPSSPLGGAPSILGKLTLQGGMTRVQNVVIR
jgi:hypothetical protein